MRIVAAFVVGALVSAGVAFFLIRTREAPAPAPAPQAVVTTVPAAPSPAPAAVEPPSTPAPQPRRAAKTAPVRKPVLVAAAPPPASPAPPARSEPQPLPAPAPVVRPAPEPDPVPPPAPKPAPVALNPPPSTRDDPGARTPHTITLPEGTIIAVRTTEKISTQTHQEGDAFAATLSAPIVVDGFVIAERNSRVDGKVAEVDKAGKLHGTAQMSLELTSITTSDGQRVPVRTSGFIRKADTSNSKDAAKVGAGAAIGAAIGAIAGGGRGAAIGAGAGGAAGGGAVVLTRGKSAEIPVETMISFRLSQPVTITEKLK